jgi:hypothetical protein
MNVVQHLDNFGRFQMDKRDLGRQREDRILVGSCRRRHSSRNPRASLLVVILINVWVESVENHLKGVFYLAV